MAAPSAMDDASVFPFTGEHGTSMSCLLEEGKYSDLTIECGKDTYAVHKAIICTRSPFFAARCDGDSKEAKSGVIKLPDDDPVAVKMMIRYLYTGTYKSPSTSASVGFTGKPLQASPNLFGPSIPATTAVAPKREPSTNPPAASTPVGSASTAQPQTFASPSTPSAPAGNGFGAQPKVSPNSPAPSTPVTPEGTAQTQTSSNPPAASAPGAGLFSTHPQYFNGGKQSGGTVSNFLFGPAHVAPFPARAPVPAPVPAQAQAATQAPVQPTAPASAPAPAPASPAPVQYSAQRKPDFLLHAKIYALGEKYEIKDLKALALQKFAFEATIYHADDSFRHGAKEAYTSTVAKDRGMRNVVVDTVLKRRYLLDQWAFQKVVKETDLCFDLLMRLRSARSLFEEHSTT